MANQGYLRYKNRLRMRGKYSNVFGECAERIYASMEKTQKGYLAYSPNTPRDVKVWISPKIIIRIKNFFRFLLTIPYGMAEAKKPSHATVPLNSVFKRVLAYTFQGWSNSFIAKCFSDTISNYFVCLIPNNSCFIKRRCVKIFFTRAFNDLTTYIKEHVQNSCFLTKMN